MVLRKALAPLGIALSTVITVSVTNSYRISVGVQRPKLKALSQRVENPNNADGPIVLEAEVLRLYVDRLPLPRDVNDIALWKDQGIGFNKLGNNHLLACSLTGK